MSQIGEYIATHPEQHAGSHQSKLNWLRAGVLGANDGIVSTAGLVVGVAGATESTRIIITAGIAGIIAGAISMAVGEYVSVSSSKDTELAMLEKERFELKNHPEKELAELAHIYQRKGLTKQTAQKVAEELTDHDPEAAHFDAELGINPNSLTNPWHASIASAISFLVGALIPVIVIILLPMSTRIPITFVSVLFALAVTGTVSAKIGGSNPLRATFRVVFGGALAMAVTYGIGRIFHVSGI